jgi:DNA-directed RNA polymerase specialized sigma24 family protein
VKNNILITNSRREDPAAFDERFWRSHKLLRFIACRVLGGPEHAEDAVERCRRTASRNPPQFDRDGAFRSWLVRVLIDEAVALLRDKERSKQAGSPFARNLAWPGMNCTNSKLRWLKTATEGEVTEDVYPAINEKHGRT